MMHIFSMKSKTKKMKIRHISDAPILFVPLCQHIGKPAEIVVKEGETVKKYQLIGKASNGLSANIHSPVSGKILEIRNHQLADGTETPTIIIENDFKENEAPHPSIDYKTKTPDELVDIIADSGIVGEGGAQFPTAFKYRGCEQRINTFIINGTECEPYLSADYALMNERTARLFEGIHIVNSILGASNIVISIERQNKELIKVFDSYLKKEAYQRRKNKT